MIKVRKAQERGHFNHGWLDTYHTFSFGHYHDPAFMGFRDLRVINEDRVAPGGGFPTHSHEDMEILTLILQGELEHKDSMGNTAVIRPGEVQRMSAGTGVTHSEYNHSRKNSVHLLQIWIIPEIMHLKPSYEQKEFEDGMRKNIWCLMASRRGQGHSVKVHQDVSLYSTLLEKGGALHYSPEKERRQWVHIASGAVKMNDLRLNASDSGAISGEEELVFRASEPSEVLLFDLA